MGSIQKENRRYYKKLINVAESNVEVSDKLMSDINKELTRIKLSCFGKTSVKGRSKSEKDIDTLQQEKIIAKDMLDGSQLEDAIKTLDNELSKKTSGK